MRGKPCRSSSRRCSPRIIPAHAGQTGSLSVFLAMAADHPRACGANLMPSHVSLPHCGSSPRMRGKPSKGIKGRHRVRIIPAHAGQTRGISARSASITDHPRACGANCVTSAAMVAVVGSSPRMRGKPEHGRAVHRKRRIIPAHAGQTDIRYTGYGRRSDHPRACGANMIGCGHDGYPFGSSPRMRGKHHKGAFIGVIVRIIPAHAGQTRFPDLIHVSPPDHPRACGANPANRSSRNLFYGSSPRMRGKRNPNKLDAPATRIIPAHAGQTLTFSILDSATTDHPRACGANFTSALRGKINVGSSPRMRGKPVHLQQRFRIVRIIPAHAGQTSLIAL